MLSYYQSNDGRMVRVVHTPIVPLALIYRLSIVFVLVLSVALCKGIAQEVIPPPWVVPAIQGTAEGGYILNQEPFLVDGHDAGETPYLRLTGGIGLVFPQLFFKSFGLSVRGNWAGILGMATTQSSEEVLGNGGQLTTVELEHFYLADIHEVTLDVQYYIHMGSVMRLELGPWFGYRYQGNYDQTAEILSPEDFSFQNGKEVQVVADGEFEVDEVAYGATLSLSAEIPFEGLGALVPSLVFRTDLSLPDKDNRWIPVSGGLGLGWLFGRTNDRLAVPEDREPPPLPDPFPELQAKIDLYSQDDTGAKRDTLFLTPVGMYTMLKVPFISCLPFSSPTGVSAHNSSPTLSLLDTVGLRLSKEKNAHLYVTGTDGRASKGNLQEIRTYFKEVWGIDSARIMSGANEPLTTSPEAYTTECLVVQSDSPEVLGPVYSQWISRRYSPGPIRLRPDITAEAGIRSWQIEVRHGGESIAIATDQQPNEGISSTALALGEYSRGTAIPDLTVEFTLTDSTGRSVVAEDSLPLQFAASGSASATSEIPVMDTVRLWLIPTDDDVLFHDELEDVAGYVSENATVVIRSFQPETSENNTSYTGSIERVRNSLTQILKFREMSQPGIFVKKMDEVPFGMYSLITKEYLTTSWVIVELTR